MFIQKFTTIIFSLCLLLFFNSLALADERDLVHHDLKIMLFPQDQRLECESLVTLPKADQTQRLFLNPKARVAEVFLENEVVPHTFQNGVLEIRIPDDLTGKRIDIGIVYQIRFEDEPAGRPGHSEDPTHGISAAITEQGTFLSAGAGWYPDPRQGDATWRLSVSAPPGYLAVTAGRLEKHETTDDYSLSVWETDLPLPGLTASAGPYEINRDKAADIPIYTYFYPQSRDLVSGYLEATVEYLEFYQQLLGPYPFEKFAVVENFFPTGYGFPSWTLLGSAVIRLPFIKDISLPHEIAHSWWGNGVRVDYSQGNWSEAVTTYVADYLMRERESKDQALDYRRGILRSYSSLVSEEDDFPLSRFIRRDSPQSRAIGYGKGAMVFHMLRMEAGEEAFWESLRRMVRVNMFERAGWDDFEEIFSDEAERNFRPFFEQWVQRPGAPELSLQDVHAEDRDGQWTVTGTITQEHPAYELNLPLYLETENQPVHETINITSEKKSFEISASSRPLRLAVDPENHIFRRLDPGEIAPAVEVVRGSDKLIAVVSAGLSPEQAGAAEILLRTLNRPDVQVFDEQDINEEDLQDKDVLFLGLPERFAGELFEQTGMISREDDEIFFDGRRLTEPETAFFAAVNPSGDPESVWAYFVPFSEEAASDAAPRIPHYGGYSYVLFKHGELVQRGILDPAGPPLEHEF